MELLKVDACLLALCAQLLITVSVCLQPHFLKATKFCRKDPIPSGKAMGTLQYTQVKPAQVSRKACPFPDWNSCHLRGCLCFLQGLFLGARAVQSVLGKQPKKQHHPVWAERCGRVPDEAISRVASHKNSRTFL